MGTTESNDLQIIIEAVNKASGELKKVENDLKSLSNEAKSAGDSATKSEKGVNSFGQKLLEMSGFAKMAGVNLGGFGNQIVSIIPQIIKFGVTVGIAIVAVKELVSIIKDSVSAYNEYETAMRGLQSVSASFGQSQDEAREAAMSLASDGLISISTAATGLKNLMSAGLGLDKSIELMKAYKDEAAYGRALTISYDQAVGNLAESFKTENSMIGNLSGQTENYNLILDKGAAMLGKTTAELTETERVQAKYLGTLEVAKKNITDTTTYSNTYQGSLSKLKATIKEIYIQIGSYFQPILKSLTDWLGRTANTTGTVLVPAMKALAYIIQGVVGVIQIAIDSLISLGDIAISVVKSIFTLSFKPLEDALSRSGNRFKSDWKGIVSSFEDIGKESIDNLNKSEIEMFDSSITEANKTAEELADLAEEYAHNLEKVNKDYKTSLEDLVIKQKRNFSRNEN